MKYPSNNKGLQPFSGVCFLFLPYVISTQNDNYYFKQ